MLKTFKNCRLFLFHIYTKILKTSSQLKKKFPSNIKSLTHIFAS